MPDWECRPMGVRDAEVAGDKKVRSRPPQPRPRVFESRPHRLRGHRGAVRRHYRRCCAVEVEGPVIDIDIDIDIVVWWI